MPAKLDPDRIGFLLTDVSRLLRGAFDRRINASRLGLTPGEARALTQVAVAEGVKQADIAAKMGVEPMTLSAYLDRLEDLGLVVRIADPGDRRAKNVVVSGKADLLIEELREELRGLMDQVTAGLDADAREALRTSLRTLRDNLQQLDRPAGPGRKSGAQ